MVSNSEDRAIKVVSDSHGDIIVTGHTDDGIAGTDMLTIKYSGADGSALWSQRYNGVANRDDEPTAVATDDSGNVVVTGFSDGARNRLDDFDYSMVKYYTAKYAAQDGALLWEQAYTNGIAQAVAVDASGNVVVTGTSRGDFCTVKYARGDGALLWEERYNGPADSIDEARGLAIDASGNAVVTGYSYNTNFNSDYYTAKYAAADGVLLWEKRYDGLGGWMDAAQAVAVDGKGDVVVTGTSYHSLSTLGADFYTAKYAAADGALVWEKSYNGPSDFNDQPRALAVDASGNVLVTGFSESGSSGRDYYTAKYAATNGALLWEKRYNGPENREDEAQAIAVDTSGNVVVTGHSGDHSTFNSDCYTAEYAAASGALLWEKRYNSPANREDQTRAVVIDAGGNTVVTGYSNDSRGYSDYYTAKYAAADGVLLWEQSYNGPANREDHATAVARAASGDVVVTGYSDNGLSRYDFYTAKYSGADGALLWAQRYDGPASLNDLPVAVAVDIAGNVVVTGASYTDIFDADYYTAKYAAADGALLWEKRYDGPANDHDRPTALAVNANGDVVVTGSSHNGFDDDDYYTAKYAGTDGALLWERRHNGSADSSDQAIAVAVDANGNVVVTGFENSGITSHTADYYTVKYAGTNGTLLWEKRYNGPENYHDYASAMALDAAGNVVVTGRSYTPFPFDRSDFYTAKYAAADGRLLWERRSSAGTDNFPTALAVDPSGNVVLVGYSTLGPIISDSYIAKYAAADGVLLWEQTFGEQNYQDKAVAGAVDANGNVVVTGYSYRAFDSGTANYYTVKYETTDGALMWEMHYNGPANGDDLTASSLALGPDGSVIVTGSSDGDFSLDMAYDYATVKYVTITYPSPVVLSLAVTPEGVRLRFTGDEGRTYRIQRAPDPVGPWATLATVTAPPGGAVEYVNSAPIASPAFYRTAAP